MINILFTICSFETGGAEKLLLDIMKYNYENPSKEHKIHVLIINNVIEEKMLSRLKVFCNNLYLLKREESNKNPKFLVKLYNIIKKNNINIIHCHDHGSKNFSIILKIFTKIKIIYTVHDTFNFNELSRIKILLHRKFVNKNIAISKSVEKHCKDYKIDKVEVIYNGIFINNYEGNKKRDSDKEAINLINVSRITHKIKGQDILIKALSICKNNGINFQCIFVGGQYKYDLNSWKYLHKLVDKYSLNNNIKFLGNCDNVPELLAESDLFILTSRKEGLGIVLLEAMAAKVPIISSNIEGPAEIICNGENGLLYDSNNEKALANLIKYAYNNSEEVDKLAINAYKDIWKYDIKNMFRNYITVYNNIFLQ